MRFRIEHQTDYKFTDAVFFEPHTLRFRPGNKPFQETKSFHLEVEPLPAGISQHVDAEGNFVHRCWFNNLHNNLTFKWIIELETEEFNPFNFIVHPPHYLKTPFSYSNADAQLLQPSLVREPIDNEIIEYTKQILGEANNDTITFISLLTQRIHAEFVKVMRLEGAPFDANTTFRLKQGACRDLSWMQLQLLRNVGIAARFVSGYYYSPDLEESFELHAWVEVYLPGAGWMGVDPSYGIFTGARHFAVASSALSENTMTISGSILGSASSTMTVKLNIEPIQD